MTIYTSICGGFHDKRMCFHGVIRDISHIKSIATKSTLGLSGFGMNLIGLNEACPLKVRQYLQMGIPVYSGVKDVFPSEFKYFCVGSIGDSMFRYAELAYHFSRAEVRDASIQFIDINKVLVDVHSKITHIT